MQKKTGRHSEGGRPYSEVILGYKKTAGHLDLPLRKQTFEGIILSIQVGLLFIKY